MRVYTKTGDKGETGLAGNIRVKKNGLRIEILGAIDELNANVGLCRSFCDSENDKLLSILQNDLFELGSLLAKKEKKASFPLSKTAFLEKTIDAIDSELPDLKNFILPGGSKSSSFLHVTRSVCRRTERRLVKLSETEKIPENSIPYLNRLSDFLFVLARFENMRSGKKDIIWKPGI